LFFALGVVDGRIAFGSWPRLSKAGRKGGNDMRLPLSGLRDWTLHYAYDDIRGWVLRTLDGEPLGKVAELIVDTDSQHVTEVVLRSGERYPAHDIWLGRHVLLLGDPVLGPFSGTVSQC
jgi:sporulation protein YlmC with PRC-barrel domain